MKFIGGGREGEGGVGIGGRWNAEDGQNHPQRKQTAVLCLQ